MKRTLLPALLAVPLIVFGVVICWVPRPGAALAQSSGAACCSAQHPEAPRELAFPYYSLRDGFSSVLQLVSDSPEPIDLTVAIHNMSGQAVFLASTIQPGQKLSFDLRQVLLKQGVDPTGSFDEGSVSVFYVGTIMPVVGQITMTNPRLDLIHESEMVENDPGRSDVPSVLNGVWWGVTGGRDALIMVTNTSADIVTADLFLDFNGQRHQSAPVVFNANETKVLSIAGVSVSEQLSWSSGVCTTSDGCNSKPTPATWATYGDGMFTDTILNCSPTCINGGSCTEAWQQTFSSNGSPLGIINSSVVGTLNCYSACCGYAPQGTTH